MSNQIGNAKMEEMRRMERIDEETKKGIQRILLVTVPPLMLYILYTTIAQLLEVAKVI